MIDDQSQSSARSSDSAISTATVPGTQQAQSLDDSRNMGKKRIRASIACNSCRMRRSKCTLEPGHEDCELCRRNNLVCVMDNTDGRKRPRRRSRGDMNSLRDRLAALESMIQDHKGHSDPIQDSIIPPSGLEINQCSFTEPYSQQTANGNLSPDGPLLESMNSLDPNFEPVGDLHVGDVPPASTSKANSNSTAIDLRREDNNIEAVIGAISPSIEEYLLNLVWSNYSTVLPFINKELFEDGKREGNSQYYRRSLEMCLLLVGLRFADRKRPDMDALFAGSGIESTLHSITKRMVEEDLDREIGLSTVQSLLFLGDFEASLSNFHLGWMYIGMASRMALSLGLDLDGTYLGLPPRDAAVRQWTLFVCVIFERYWVLIFNQSPTVTQLDVRLLHCATQVLVNPAGLPQDDPFSMTLNASNFLQEVVASSKALQKLGADANGRFERNDYFMAVGLSSELHTLYSSLPDRAKWSTVNLRNADSGFFLLHQHFYVDLILLHRPFAQFQPFTLFWRDMGESEFKFERSNGNPDRLCQISRMICFTHAITLTQIFQQHHARFNASRMIFQAVGHAEIAASTLLLCLIHTNDVKKRDKAAACLHVLIEILQALASTYKLAEKIFKGVKNALQQWTRHNSTIDIALPEPSGEVWRHAPNDIHPADSMEKHPNKKPRLLSHGYSDDTSVTNLSAGDELVSGLSSVSLPLNIETNYLGSTDSTSTFHPGASIPSLPSLPPQLAFLGEIKDMSSPFFGTKNWHTNLGSGQLIDGRPVESPFSAEKYMDFDTEFDQLFQQTSFPTPAAINFTGDLAIEAGAYAVPF